MLQKKYPLISKRVAEWKQVGLFLSTQTVLFDLGCINVLKNLKCLDKLKSDSISFAAKQLLSPRGTSPPGDGGAMHAADRSLQPPTPVPQQPSIPRRCHPLPYLKSISPAKAAADSKHQALWSRDLATALG